MREVALYDPHRNPASWMDLIHPNQYAVFLSDVESDAELTLDGTWPQPNGIRTCLIFDSLEEAEQFCRKKIEELPRLKCQVFDSHGRANPPVATLVGESYRNRLDSPEKAQRTIWLAVLTIAVSLPLFWYTWKTRGEMWLAAFLGIQFFLIGLRLLHWGYGMKEELRYRQQQMDLRKEPQDTTRIGKR